MSEQQTTNKENDRFIELEELMKDRNCSSAKLSKLTGLQASNICHYLTNRRKPRGENLCKIADALICTTDELLGLKQINKIDPFYNPETDLDFIEDTHEQDIKNKISRIKSYIKRLERFGI
jgi:predicted transcriptional regulator